MRGRKKIRMQLRRDLREGVGAGAEEEEEVVDAEEVPTRAFSSRSRPDCEDPEDHDESVSLPSLSPLPPVDGLRPKQRKRMVAWFVMVPGLIDARCSMRMGERDHSFVAAESVKKVFSAAWLHLGYLCYSMHYLHNVLSRRRSQPRSPSVVGIDKGPSSEPLKTHRHGGYGTVKEGSKVKSPFRPMTTPGLQIPTIAQVEIP